MGLNSSGHGPGLFCFNTFAAIMKNLCVPLLVVLIAAAGCERTIDFDLDEPGPKLVVEATVENDRPPVVILSRSLNYFSTIDPQILATSFVHDAEVYVSNGLKIQKLKEYNYKVNNYTLYYYSIDSTNPASAFVGELNKSYSLR